MSRAMVAGLLLSAWLGCVHPQALVGDTDRLMVASLCHRQTVYHNQFVDSAGHWVSDLQYTGGCLLTQQAIVDFCRRVYPAHSIANATQLPEAALIESWCRVEMGPCDDAVWVRPFRCEEVARSGTTERVTTVRVASDRTVTSYLMAGSELDRSSTNCSSHQISNGSQCWRHQKWSSVASQHCQKRSKTLGSFFTVYPCGADVFTGVDFKCCSKNVGYAESSVLHDTAYSGETTTSRRADVAGYDEDYEDYLDDEQQMSDIEDEIEDIEHNVYQTPARDPYYTKFDPSKEHSAFKSAIKRLNESYRIQSNKIMNEWDELEVQYRKLKTSDKERAEKFKEKMMERFQRLIAALKRRSSSEKLRLRALHQQRMAAHLANLRRDGLACYNRSLSAPTPAPASVHRCLGRLLRALYRDRHHTISHFRHLSSAQPAEAARARISAAAHLRQVQRSIDSSVQRLDQFPQLKFVLMPQVSQMLGRLQRRDSVPVELSYVEEPSTVADSGVDAATVTVVAPAFDTMDKRRSDEVAPVTDELNTQYTSGKYQPLSEQSVSIEVQTLPVLHAASGDALSVLVRAPDSDKVTSYRLTAPAAAGLMAWSHGGRMYFLGGLAIAGVVMAVVCAAIATRRRNRLQYQRRSSDELNGFMEIDQPVHLDHLQANGYENPTYKYFDK